jgi:hypothetical protein
MLADVFGIQVYTPKVFSLMPSFFFFSSSLSLYRYPFLVHDSFTHSHTKSKGARNEQDQVVYSKEKESEQENIDSHR